jgi:hypothetical protein
MLSGISDFKEGYQPGTNIVWDEKGALVENSTVFWLGGGTIFLSCLMYVALVKLGRHTHTHQNH